MSFNILHTYRIFPSTAQAITINSCYISSSSAKLKTTSLTRCHIKLSVFQLCLTARLIVTDYCCCWCCLFVCCFSESFDNYRLIMTGTASSRTPPGDRQQDMECPGQYTVWRPFVSGTRWNTPGQGDQVVEKFSNFPNRARLIIFYF